MLPPNMSTANDNLSRCISSISRELRNQAESYRNFRDYHAPRELLTSLGKMYNQKIDEILSGYGFTRESFLDAVADRTSDRYVYFSGLIQIHPEA